MATTERILSATYYRHPSSGQCVAVLTGMPKEAVRIGTGRTPRQAYADLQATPIQSAGGDSGRGASLCWAAAQWESPAPEELERIAVGVDDLDDAMTAWADEYDVTPLTQREGWASEVETSPDDSRVWLRTARAGVALAMDKSTGEALGFVVLDSEGCPRGRHTSLDDAAREAETMAEASIREARADARSEG